MNKHTPTPWEYIEKSDNLNSYIIITKTIAGETIAYCGGCGKDRNEANAKFIVKCCNNHYELIKALRVAEITLNKESAWFNKAAAINTINEALKNCEE